MTYCLGIKTKNGLVGLSDTRITSGTETTSSKKVFTVNKNKHCFFIMTSGLRSVRDKTITYFSEMMETEGDTFNKLYKTVGKFGDLVKQVAKEDKASLEENGFNFNLHAIIGGQLENDNTPKLFLLYPEGNWIEIGQGTPFVIIGNKGSGHPILKRSITFDESLEYALKSAFLSFDATRISANDVGYPIDTLLLRNDSYFIHEHRFEEADLRDMSTLWNSMIRKTIDDLPAKSLETVFTQKTPAQINKISLKS
ncbi:MAG: proteasome-type protease [Balneolaceae bacterium]